MSLKFYARRPGETEAQAMERRMTEYEAWQKREDAARKEYGMKHGFKPSGVALGAGIGSDKAIRQG